MDRKKYRYKDDPKIQLGLEKRGKYTEEQKW
jgi:hypothetical protein